MEAHTPRNGARRAEGVEVAIALLSVRQGYDISPVRSPSNAFFKPMPLSDGAVRSTGLETGLRGSMTDQAVFPERGLLGTH